MQWTFYQFNFSTTNEKEILQSASDKTSENMFPNSFPFQFCIFEFGKSRFLFWFTRKLNSSEYVKTSAFIQTESLTLLPIDVRLSLLFFQKHCNEFLFKFAHFHFASFLLKSFLYLNNGFLQALESFFARMPSFERIVFRLERSELMKMNFFSNSSEYVFKFIHWRAGWQNLANWIITESHTGVRLLMYLRDATVSPH